MRLVEATEGERWMHEAAEAARQARCTRAKCGCVVVRDGAVIGSGYNAPPKNDQSHCHCDTERAYGYKPQYDRTCCMHAEWRGILDALRRNPSKLEGAQLYFVRVDDQGEPQRSGEPYCTVCSRLALDSGIGEFVLWHDAGITAYDAAEYDARSYANLNAVS